MHKAQKFYSDPRLQEAKKLVLSALTEAQKEFSGVEAPKEAYLVEYETLLEDFLKTRGYPLYYPFIGSGLGKGALVELLDGSVKYDLISGIGVHYFGHSSPEIIQRTLDAAVNDTVMQGNLQQNHDSLVLSQLLCAVSGLDHCFLSSSGAMACENALKIAFQKKHPATRVLAFDRAFAGRTLALSQITDKPSFREGLPPTLVVDYLPFFDPKDPEESEKRTLTALKNHIRRYPKQHAVMIFELVQGEGGFWTATSDYFKNIIQLLKEHEIAVWIDEVQTFARTHELFAFQHFDLEGLVDIVSIGKVSPCCATLFRKEYCPRVGLLSQTFTAATSSIRVAKFTIEHTMQNGFFGPDGKIAKLHQAFTQGLARLHEQYGCVVGPYGLGTMIAFTPFDGTEEQAKAFVQKLFSNGVMSFVAGTHPTRVRFLLPVAAMGLEDLAPIFAIIEKTIQESLS